MKIPDPKIRVTNNIGEIGTRSFDPSSGVQAARIAYLEGATAMAAMFHDALESKDLPRVLALAKATERASFYDY